MKKRFVQIAALVIGAVMLCSLCACGGNDNADSANEGAKTKITSDGGNVIGYERKYHNDNGDITRLDVYDKDENYDHYIVYEYDDNHRLIKETCYKANGIGDYYYTYTYNDDGVLTEKGYYTMMNGATRTLYDEKGVAIEKFTYDSDDKLIKHEINENGIWKDGPLEEPDKVSDDDKADEKSEDKNESSTTAE